MLDVGIIDYGMGNIGSIVNMLRRVGARPQAIKVPDELKETEGAILPGIGAFDNAMNKLHAGGWLPVLEQYARRDMKPMMGICLGMQLMTESSEEGVEKGLGWIDGHTVRFDLNKMKQPHRIPHMGWDLANVEKENVLFDPREEEERFYFVHSYHVVCNKQQEILTTTDYGYPFVSSFQQGHILGFQFHPEKSHRFGMQLLKRFVEEF